MVIKRLFDILLSLVGIVILLPIFIVVSILIKLSSKGPVFYRQLRVGRYKKDFKIFKFRTMLVDADKKGLLTVGGKDPRITSVGYYLRKYKIDELPQLINVFIGEMSLVGPRPEVRKYVDLYNDEQLEILNVRPGVTDMASIEFRNENELLFKQEDPYAYYIDVIMQKKLQINLEYLRQRSLLKDIGVIFKTLLIILK